MGPGRSGSAQYADSRNLSHRGGLHARYAGRNWFGWVAGHAGLVPSGDVLDVGCGAGWFWSSQGPELPAGLRLALIDSSPGMVAEATRRLSDHHAFASVAGHVADAVALPFADGSFDAAMAMHVLYHVSSPARAIEEMARVLRPGGVAVVTTNADDNLAELFALGAQAFGGSAADPAAALFGIDAAHGLLKLHFSSVTVETFEDSYAIRDSEDILAYLASFPPGIDASAEQIDMARGMIEGALARHGGVLATRRRSALIRACGTRG